MDNLRSHKVAGCVGDRAAGATLMFHSTLQPDLNPIEMAFAKLKALLYEPVARTVDALWKTPEALSTAHPRGVCQLLFPIGSSLMRGRNWPICPAACGSQITGRRPA